MTNWQADATGPTYCYLPGPNVWSSANACQSNGKRRFSPPLYVSKTTRPIFM